jgi:hypothetical protein
MGVAQFLFQLNRTLLIEYMKSTGGAFRYLTDYAMRWPTTLTPGQTIITSYAELAFMSYGKQRNNST